VDRHRRMALAALVSLTAGIDPAKPPQELTENLREADLQVTRLPPSAFPELPKNIRRELEQQGWTIPQVWSDKKPQNVIKREFTRKGQTNWAVLCSLNRVSTILTFRNASEQVRTHRAGVVTRSLSTCGTRSRSGIAAQLGLPIQNLFLAFFGS